MKTNNETQLFSISENQRFIIFAPGDDTNEQDTTVIQNFHLTLYQYVLTVLD